MKTKALLRLLAIPLWLAGGITALAQGTAFTYQGRLNDNGVPATGLYDFRLTACAASTGANTVGGPLTASATAVTNGLFTVMLDFGSSVFTGSQRWLEIAVRTNGAASFVPLNPRQAITATPYAIFAANAGGGGTGPWLLNGSDTYYNAGNVGIGTDFPVSGLTVRTPYYGIEHTDGDVRLVTSVGTIEPIGGGLGTASNHKLKFFVNNGLPSMTIDTNANVGIGTSSPPEKLTIAGVSSYNNGLKLTGNADAGTGLALENTSAGGHKYSFLSGGLNTGVGPGGFGIFDDTIGDYRLAISPNGRVGIGTTAPASPLTVLSPAYGIEQTDGNIRLGTYVGAGAGWLGTINDFPLSFFVNGGGATLTLDPRGWIQANESLSINGPPWYDSPLTLRATGSTRTALMIFDPNSIEALSMTLSPNLFRVIGDASKSSGGTSWGVISDRRVKKDVRDYENGLDDVLKLRPVRFHYRDDPERGLNSSDEEVGFIAQEVREVIPDAVTVRQDGYLALKADPIHWAAINAIQQLNAKLEEQRADNAELKRSVTELEELVRELAAQQAGRSR